MYSDFDFILKTSTLINILPAPVFQNFNVPYFPDYKPLLFNSARNSAAYAAVARFCLLSTRGRFGIKCKNKAAGNLGPKHKVH